MISARTWLAPVVLWMYFQKDVRDFEGFLVHMSKEWSSAGNEKEKERSVCEAWNMKSVLLDSNRFIIFWFKSNSYRKQKDQLKLKNRLFLIQSCFSHPLILPLSARWSSQRQEFWVAVLMMSSARRHWFESSDPKRRPQLRLWPQENRMLLNREARRTVFLHSWFI